MDHFEERAEQEWPLARTQWSRLYMDVVNGALTGDLLSQNASQSFDALSDGLTFLTPPLLSETEVTGPSAVKLFASSSTQDADFFVVLRVFSADLREVVFQGAIDPHTPIGQGWLRASHRILDPSLSMPWRPFHPHDEIQLVRPER